MLRSRFAVAASVVLVALLSVPAWGTNAPANSALPGTLN